MESYNQPFWKREVEDADIPSAPTIKRQETWLNHRIGVETPELLANGQERSVIWESYRRDGRRARGSEVIAFEFFCRNIRFKTKRDILVFIKVECPGDRSN